jgi:DedD protein
MSNETEETEHTEFTLGTGKLLAFFLAVAIMCGIFFSLGYSIGKNSTPLSVQIGEPSGVPLAKSTQGTKPAASASAPVQSGPMGPAVETAPPSQPAAAPAGSSDRSSAANPDNNSAAPAPISSTAKSGKTLPAGELTVNPQSSGFLVQVAAVSKQEDAEALVAALRRKSYPVFMTSIPSDKLFHVQVGPFSELKDAEAMRGKLVGDGYNAILKK